MRLLLVNQFYPPDVAPTGRFLQDLARELAARGHQVHVWASGTTYGANAGDPARAALDDGVHVRRLGPPGDFGRRGYGRRAGQGAAFLGRVALARRPPDIDLVLALTSPPFLGLAAAWAARRRRARLVHWVMDVYPDALASHGWLSARGLPARLLGRLTRAAFARSDLVIALGPFMAARLRALVPATVRVESVPLWGDPGPAPVAPANPQGGDDWSVLYSGNVGLGHRLDEFLEAARRLGPSGPRWIFAGDGARRGQIEAFVRAHPHARVELQPYLAGDGHHERLRAADVHLASLDPAWQGVIAPSKVQAAFALGRPLLFVGAAENEAAAWVRESGGGWVCAPGDVGGLLAALTEAGCPAERARRGAAAAAYAARHFDRGANLARLADLFESAGCARRASLAG
jgi:glycosyltransferase involved in cell wall biosynthesis